MPLAALILASLAAAGEVLAVAYFDAHSVRPEIEPLGRGVADMLTTDLAGAPGLRLVERQRLAEVLSELQLGKGGFVDPATAQALGRGVGATGVVVGSLTVAVEGMRLDARVIDVATGEVRASAQASGREEEFFRLEAEVARELLAGLGVEAPVTERAMALDQIVAGSRAIDAADAALLARLRGLREYKEHRLVRVAAPSGGWFVAEGGLTPLTTRQFIDRTGDEEGEGRLVALARRSRSTGAVMAATGAGLTMLSALMVYGALEVDRVDPGDDLGMGVLLTGGILFGTAGLLVLPAGVGAAAAPGEASGRWPLPFVYTPEQVDLVLRSHNARLAATHGVSEADALALELK